MIKILIKGYIKAINEYFSDGQEDGIEYSATDLKIIKSALEKVVEYEDLEEQGKLLSLPCKVGDTVYDLVYCTDHRWRIFKMKVCAVNAFGGMHNLNRQVWNVYLEDDYSKDYVSFYDFGKTVFLTREEAEQALKEKISKKEK